MVARYLALLLLLTSTAQADTRYCGPPQRDADGSISRSTYVIYQFRKQYPCPATGQITGRCAGWSVDHVIPLACGGCDSVENLAWMPNVLKSGAGILPKDRWEQKVYCVAKREPVSMPSKGRLLISPK